LTDGGAFFLFGKGKSGRSCRVPLIPGKLPFLSTNYLAGMVMFFDSFPGSTPPVMTQVFASDVPNGAPGGKISIPHCNDIPKRKTSDAV